MDSKNLLRNGSNTDRKLVKECRGRWIRTEPNVDERLLSVENKIEVTAEAQDAGKVSGKHWRSSGSKKWTMIHSTDLYIIGHIKQKMYWQECCSNSKNIGYKYPISLILDS